MANRFFAQFRLDCLGVWPEFGVLMGCDSRFWVALSWVELPFVSLPWLSLPWAVFISSWS